MQNLSSPPKQVVTPSTVQNSSSTLLVNDPLWFKDAIIYEVPVRAFADSDGDGIGDFRGLTEKLDYIQDLGVTAIWILPFFPSPLRDDGYDVSDYFSVNPIYGTLEDFQAFLDAAHQRGIRVIIELIVNHTSDQHPWFQRARKAPVGSRERDFYVWSETPEKYPGVRVIFQDFETSNWSWDPVAKQYYWHRFYSHQPDLNFDSPDVQQALFDVVDFWLDMGVDGMRLDAVPYLYEREGTNCENLPETHVFLKDLRQHIDSKYENRMLLAEANQWPEDAVQYYGAGDECQMDFHFPLMPRLFMSLQMEDSFPIIDILQQTPQIPDNCQWALFLRNHDELTLEMVSDEDRDYMYRVYAQDPQARINLGIRRRLAPLMGNNRRRIELMNSLLLSLPGTPVIYYGDEVGMGDNIYLGDRNGVRTPMQWSADRNGGFSRANPQRLYAPPIVDPEYHYEAINVEAQRANSNSLWWWMKRLIALRGRYQAFGRGTFEFLYPENRKVLAFTRTYRGEHILVVANLSRFVQVVELDLSHFQGMVPIEMFGRASFPAVGEEPYFLSLGPHAFFWFTLQPQHSPGEAAIPQANMPTLAVVGKWQNIFTKPESRLALEAILPTYLRTCRWFGGKARVVQTVHIIEAIPIEPSALEPSSKSDGKQSHPYHLVLLRVEYTEGIPETYVLPLAYETIGGGGERQSAPPERAIAQIHQNGDQAAEVGVLYEALSDKDFLTFPLDAIAHKRRFRGTSGEFVATATDAFPELCGDAIDTNFNVHLEPHLLKGEQSNSSIVYGDRLILKLFRKVEEGLNPDLEIGRFLTDHRLLEHLAPVGGALEYRRPKAEPMTLGILLKFVPDTRDAWSYTLDTLRDLFEKIMAMQVEADEITMPPALLAAAIETEIPDLAYEVMGSYLTAAELLGQRTAELHIALASDDENPNFAPEAFSSFYQRSIYQYMRNLAGQALLLLKKQIVRLPIELQPLAQTVLNQKEIILGRFGFILNQKITAMRTRCHGDYHLGQVLYTGKDFIIIDFEGEPARPLSERRMKRSPLRDVAGMLQSFYYASQMALRHELESGLIRPENQPLMEQWAQFLYCWSSISFLKSYLTTAKDAAFLPKAPQELQVLLDAYLLEKAIYELAYELNNRPTWADIPLNRILQLLDSSQMGYWKS
ncbi:maltose alpha-D-glucosyltransferase [Oculatella sp. LEGE 06141]|uniref:maltose alpha-D-glucosyltransferase n=1 Tax=Oculatella sp. LEGE 06141 TaxID=1828648 RepID=UPI00188019A0|nr:maltose alpha-D-glucosyltransferase [Oculatella sp. LEGE 06141]MBE9181784.1 maltose alpha-D-glucosyltransferase [Oculatella sp. LEGE 06141]